MAWQTWARFIGAVAAYSLWGLFWLEPDDDQMLGWTLFLDVTMAGLAGWLVRRIPSGGRFAWAAVLMGTAVGLAAAFSRLATLRDDTGLAALLFVLLCALHLVLAFPMAALAAAIVRRSQRRFPLETMPSPA